MPKLTAKDINWLTKNQPNLMLFTRPDRYILEGKMQFNRSFNKTPIKDAYYIRLEQPYSDNEVPTVIETGGRLKAVIEKYGLDGPEDLHAYPDWVACLAAPQDLRLSFLPDPKTEILFRKYIEHYFYSQSYYEQNYPKWPWDHFSHGVYGLLDWYDENIGLQQALNETARAIREQADKYPGASAAKMVSRAMTRDSFNPRSKCLCGRGSNYLQCHRSYIKLALALRKSAS